MMAAKILYHGRLIKMGGQFLKALLILCLCCTQHCVSFGIAGSEIRANRAPITCFPNPLPSSFESRRYNSGSSNSGSSDSSDSSTVGATKQNNDDVSKKNQLEQNTKYVNGLISTLESLLDQYVISGSMPTVRYQCINLYLCIICVYAFICVYFYLLFAYMYHNMYIHQLLASLTYPNVLITNNKHQSYPNVSEKASIQSFATNRTDFH